MPFNKTEALIVGGKALMPPAGLSVTNYLAGDVHRFSGRDRAGRAVTELVLHETVTRSVADTVSVLKRRGLGVHFIVGPDGRVTRHADLANDRLAHAAGHRGTSVGIEVVSPYYPANMRAGLPWVRVIDAPWAEGGAYALPTPEQAEATAKLVRWLTSSHADGLSIPRTWTGLDAGQLAMGRVPGADRRRPGVYAHTYWNHADGAWLILYCWLRIEAGLAPCAAYEEAARRASGVHHAVPVADLEPGAVAAVAHA